MVAITMHGFRKGTPVPDVELVVTRIRSRFIALARHAIAGRLRKPRPKRQVTERQVTEHQVTARPEGWTPKPRAKSPWPTEFGWAVKLLGANGAHGAQHMGYLVNSDADMAALLAAAPQAGRILRQLFWMMGEELPMALRLPDALRPPPAGYVPGNERYCRRNPVLGPTLHEKLITRGWRAAGHFRQRTARPEAVCRAAEAKRLRAADRARDEARLAEGGGLSQRPPPRSWKLGI